MKEEMTENKPISLVERVEMGEVLGWEDVAQQIISEGEIIGLHPSIEELNKLMSERLFYFGNGIFLEKLLEGIKYLKQRKQIKGKAKVMVVTTERGLGRWLKIEIRESEKTFRPFRDEANFTFLLLFLQSRVAWK